MIVQEQPAVAPVVQAPPPASPINGDDNDEPLPEIHEPDMTKEEREAYWKELVAAREKERLRDIAEGRMDDPNVPKRLEDAITRVGTCPDMCPRFERYRREREGALYVWEQIPGTKRVDHQRAVKQYERAVGDKAIPSDIRPPHVLRKTIDYLFYDLMPRASLKETVPFIRDRLRAVRNDFVLQLISDHRSIHAHERVLRFHIAMTHLLAGTEGFEVAMEVQQLANTLQTLKEHYEEQRGKYESPNELEVRVYHRLFHIRDQVERHDDIPDHIRNHPVFKLTTEFRQHVQKKSAPITKKSQLIADEHAMQIFGHLAGVLREMGNTVMIYLVACALEWAFGKGTVEGIDDIRGGLSIQDIFEGRSNPPALPQQISEVHDDQSMMEGDEQEDEYDQFLDDDEPVVEETPLPASNSWPGATTEAKPSPFGRQPGTTSVFGRPGTAPAASVFPSSQSTPAITAPNAFATLTAQAQSTGPFGSFGAPVASSSAPKSVFETLTSSAKPPATSTQSQSRFPTFTITPTPTPPPSVFFSAPSTQPAAPANSTPTPSLVASSSAATKIPSLLERLSAPIPSLPPPSFSSSNTSTSGQVFQPTNTTTNDGNNLKSLNPQAALFTPSSSVPQATEGQSNALVPASSSSSFFSPSLARPMPMPEPPTRTRSNSSNSSRGTPPIALKIDTSVSSSSASSTNPSATTTTSSMRQGQGPVAISMPSPREPPPLERMGFVSLPSTPTIMGPPPSAHVAYLKGALGTPPTSGGSIPRREGSFSASGVLSPLVLQTPRTSFFPPMGLSSSFSPAPSRGSLSAQGSKADLAEGSSAAGSSSSSSLAGTAPPPASAIVFGTSSAKEQIFGVPLVSAPTFGASSSAKKSAFGLGPPTPPTPPSPTKVSSSGGTFGMGLVDKGKGKAKARSTSPSPLPDEVQAMMLERADEFEKRGTLVKECWEMWVGKVVEKARWLEACRQSEAYREKVRMQRAMGENGKGKGREVVLRNGGMNGDVVSAPTNGNGSLVVMDKKRRISATMGLSTARSHQVDSPQRKRAKKRVSSAYQERVPEEELVKKFKQNQEDLERRWAQGTFLDALKSTFAKIVPSTLSLTDSLSASTSTRPQRPFALPSTWEAWISLNPDSDATAIWIERKFNVPDSGKWVDNMFWIPVGEGMRSTKEHPGLILFECSPLEGMEDEIERKYRVLDDCSRLRDAVRSLPAGRYYDTSIVFLCWAHNTDSYSDLLAMADKLVKDGTIGDYKTALLRTEDRDLDATFQKALDETALDVQGKRVRSMSVRDMFKQFLTILNPFIAEWVNSCYEKLDHFNWKLYNLLIHILVDLLNKVVTHLRGVCEVAATGSGHLPEFADGTIDNSESAYDYAEEWLSAVSSDIDVALILVDLESHRNIEQDFPVRAFIDHLLEIAQAKAEDILNGPTSHHEDGKTHLVLKSEFSRSMQTFDDLLAPLRVQLSHRLNKTSHRSPKRRKYSMAAGSDRMMQSPDSKRMRLSATPSYGGDHDISAYSSFLTPTPSVSVNGRGATLNGVTPSVSVSFGRGGSPTPSAISVGSSSSSMAGVQSRMSQTPEAGGETRRKEPSVTVAMLRALTQDMKKKYIRTES